MQIKFRRLWQSAKEYALETCSSFEGDAVKPVAVGERSAMRTMESLAGSRATPDDAAAILVSAVRRDTTSVPGAREAAEDAAERKSRTLNMEI